MRALFKRECVLETKINLEKLSLQICVETVGHFGSAVGQSDGVGAAFRLVLLL